MREFEDTSELPWFHGDGVSYYVDQIKDTLQGFKFLEIKADELTQAKLLHSISSKLDMRFIGDFAMELRRQLSDENRRGQSEVFKLLGKSARNLFDFAMLYKEDPAYNLEMIIAYHGITNIAVTYCSDIDESKKRLKHVLTLINTPDFPIRFVSSILEELKCINACDTEFVAEIYKTVFSHVENERTQTEMGRSFMMKFMTNRVDDYELCKFRLKEFFPIFLRENSALAIKVSLELISIYIERKYQGGILIKDHIKIPEHFNINGVESDYFPDMSHFWGQYLDNVKEIEILEHVFEYFDMLLAERKYNALKEHLQAYLKAAHYALTWKLLLEWAAGHPEELHAILFELLLSPAIFYWKDTAEATTTFLSAALPFYVPEQINKIELAVRSIPEFVSGEDHLNAEQKAQRFLSFISSLKSRTIESKNVLVKIPEVELKQEFTDSYVHSKHPRTVAEKTVTEISDSQYNTVGDNISRLTEFARMHENIPPDFETLSQILNISKTIFPETEEEKNKDSSLALITTLSSVFIIGMKSALDNRGRDPKIPIDYALVKKVLTDATAVHTASDEYAEKNYNLSSPYTNTAKSEAAGGVIFLYKLTGDSQLLPLIEKLSNDKSPIVRFRLINQIGLLYNDQADLFWKVILERLRNEKDLSILGMIVTKLERRNIIDNERSKFIDALRLSAVRQPSNVETNKNFYEPFLVVCLVGLRLTNDSSIEEIIDNFIKENFDGTPLMIYHIFKIVEPGNFRRNYENAEDLKSSQYLLQIVVNLVKQCGGKLLAVKNLPEVTQEGSTSFLILDEVIKRVYFSLQVNERLKKMNRDRRSASKKEQQIFYYLVKPILKEFLNLSLELSYVQPTTAHSFIQILTHALDYDPEFSIFNIRKITEMAMMSGYLGDRSSIEEAIKFANKLLTDHRELLTDQNAFVELSKLLEIYVKAGWPEALELLWKFDEIFK